MSTIIIPPSLKKGDIIGITCPAGFLPMEKANHCIHTLQKWGYEVMLGKTVGSKSENYFSGSDEERTDELQAMLDNPDIKAILLGRGGYGTSRIIDRINFKAFKKNPKWLIGFSDITLLHTHVHANCKVATMHSPMAAAFNLINNDSTYTDAINNCLKGRKNRITCDAHPFNRKGTSTGQLVGGNLAILTHVIGTKSDIDTKGKILFIEDVGEYLYNTDRMLHQLKRSGKLKNLAGLIFGGFTENKDTERPFGQSLEQILNEAVKEYDYPVCFGFPISHGYANFPVKTGVEHQLKITSGRVTLTEK
jgi:muramoyltetrapeptide carboxypeptidase